MTHTALVVTVSTRAATGEYEDRSGPVLVEGLATLGFEVWARRRGVLSPPVAGARAGVHATR